MCIQDFIDLFEFEPDAHYVFISFNRPNKRTAHNGYTCCLKLRVDEFIRYDNLKIYKINSNAKIEKIVLSKDCIQVYLEEDLSELDD